MEGTRDKNIENVILVGLATQTSKKHTNKCACGWLKTLQNQDIAKTSACVVNGSLILYSVLSQIIHTLVYVLFAGLSSQSC